MYGLRFIVLFLPFILGQEVTPAAQALSSKGGCIRGRGLQGKLDSESQVLQHTVEYGNVPDRWGASQLNELPNQDHAFQAVQRSERCTQSVCVACGWRPPKIDESRPESKVEGAERCLYLSMFTPQGAADNAQNLDQSKLLPIVFHVHHGQMLYGFKTGMGEVKKVTQRGIAVGNANFRLGVFGFLAHPDLEQTNAGQQDLMSALGWIQRYGCQVGADPSRVTATGSSSGASQVLMLLASSAASGLFHSAWIHSMTTIGTPNFFSQNVAHTFESSILPMMKRIGCGTLNCMRDMREKRLVLDLGDTDSMLVRFGLEGMKKGEAPFAFDGHLVPNMLEVGCSAAMANGHLPVVVGQGKDELDTLKFQFPLKAMIQNMLKQSMANTNMDKVEKKDCIQRKILNVQGIQETMEDAMFNIGSYAAGTKHTGPGSGPRWHFLFTAPASATKRSWHTSTELLTWSPNQKENSDQYDALTKDFVLRNAMPELRHYSHDNFVHFIRTANPQDRSWSQTKEVADGELGGLPSKVWDQKPLEGRLYWEKHHSNRTVRALHGLFCKKENVLNDPSLDLNECVENPPPPTALDSLNELRQTLSVFKNTDLQFNMELLKAFSSPENKAWVS